MLPEDFRQRIKHQEYIDSEGLSNALQIPSPVSIRINSRKWNQIPLNSEPVPWCKDGFYLDKRPSFTLDPLFHAGCYYPQEASGMFLEQVFKQVAGEQKVSKVLDLCGAPGGKSTHLASLIGVNGFLVANEVIRQRALVLAENLTKWGLPNTMVTQSDPSSFGRIKGFFDMILVDAPCSGEGMFRDPVAVSEWSLENTALCCERQKRILMDVWPALKENGILVYSTCTFNPGENEENIKWLTGKKNAVPVKLNISDYDGITEIDLQGIKGYGFYPDRIRGEGLFIAVLRKDGPNEDSSRRIRTDNKNKLTKDERTVLSGWSLSSEERMIKAGDEFIESACAPSDYLLLSENLKIIKAGTRIGTVKTKNYIPAHDLAMSVNFRKESFPSVNLDLHNALLYLKRESIVLSKISTGWMSVLYNDVPLGFINNLPGRVNNYYPSEWRVRMQIPESGTENILKWEKAEQGV